MNTYARGEEGIEALHTGQKQKADTHGLVPVFFNHRVAKEDGTLLVQECVKIIVPGDMKTESIRKVTTREKQMFPDAYEAWKRGEGYEVDGTSLELFLGRDDPRIPDLRYAKIRTVEELAGMSDTHVQNLGMGFRELRDQAKAFIARKTGTDALMAQNEEMQAQMKEMREQMAALTAGGPKEVEPEAPRQTEDIPFDPLVDGVKKGDEYVKYSGYEEMTITPESPAPETFPEAPKQGVNGGTPELPAPKFSVAKEFGGKYSVKLADGTSVFSDTGKGAKERCYDWIRNNEIPKAGETQ